MNEITTRIKIEGNGDGELLSYEHMGDTPDLLWFLENAIEKTLEPVDLTIARNLSIEIQERISEYIQQRQEQEGEAQ